MSSYFFTYKMMPLIASLYYSNVVKFRCIACCVIYFRSIYYSFSLFTHNFKRLSLFSIYVIVVYFLPYLYYRITAFVFLSLVCFESLLYHSFSLCPLLYSHFHISHIIQFLKAIHNKIIFKK